MCDSPRCTAMYRDLPQCTAVYRNLPRFTAIYRDLPRLTATYRDLPRFTANYRSTATYRDLPRLTAIYRFTAIYRDLPRFTATYRDLSHVSNCIKLPEPSSTGGGAEATRWSHTWCSTLVLCLGRVHSVFRTASVHTPPPMHVARCISRVLCIVSRVLMAACVAPWVPRSARSSVSRRNSR